MNYQTFEPHPDLDSIVKCYWTLEVPAQENIQRQRILPDGCIELFFILGDDVKRYTSEDDFLIQPRAMVLGQITDSFYIEPTGYVKTFAVRFYPQGFSSITTIPIKELANKETSLEIFFGKSDTKNLSEKIIKADSTEKKIQIIERFIFANINKKITIDNIVRETVDTIFLTKGKVSIKTILEDSSSRRRQLERKFLKQIGISPKQLGRVVRLQTVLKMLLDKEPGSITKIAYENEYYDQAHFIKDFREFTGTTPKEFLGDEELALSSLLYRSD